MTINIEEPPESSKAQDEKKNERCSACNPKLLTSKVILYRETHNLLITILYLYYKPNIPEERIPWNPPKQKLSTKLRSLSIHTNGVSIEK